MHRRHFFSPLVHSLGIEPILRLSCSTDGATWMLKINRKQFFKIHLDEIVSNFRHLSLCVYIYVPFHHICIYLPDYFMKIYLSWNSCAVHEEFWWHLSLVALLQFRRSRATWNRVMWPSCWSTQWCWCVSCAPHLSNTAVSSLWVRSASAGSQITRATLWSCVDLTAIPAASSTTTPPTQTVCIEKFG